MAVQRPSAKVDSGAEYAADNPGDTDFIAELECRRAFHDAQQRWGRDAMGFGLYLFRR